MPSGVMIEAGAKQVNYATSRSLDCSWDREASPRSPALRFPWIPEGSRTHTHTHILAPAFPHVDFPPLSNKGQGLHEPSQKTPHRGSYRGYMRSLPKLPGFTEGVVEHSSHDGYFT